MTYTRDSLQLTQQTALLVWIQPRRSFGSAAYIQSPRVLRILISLPGGSARTLFAVSAVARRACTSLPVTIASPRPSLPVSRVWIAQRAAPQTSRHNIASDNTAADRRRAKL